LPRQFAPPSAEKFGLENAHKAFAKASKISRPVTTLAAGNLFTPETDEHVIVDSGGEKCISAGNIWRVDRLDRGHDPVMVVCAGRTVSRSTPASRMLAISDLCLA